jgi:ABC-type nitrate/sulfonate/bicarbonate transport system substrate-binding protein
MVRFCGVLFKQAEGRHDRPQIRENWEDAMTTRRLLLQAGLGSLTAAAVGGRFAARAAPALQKVKAVIPQDSVYVLSYYGGKDAGIYAKHGIDVEIDTRPFAGFLAALPSKQCMVTTYPGLGAIQKINEGMDWVITGPGLTTVADVIVLKDSPYKTGADLRGKKFGVFSTGADAFKAVRATMIEAFNLDVVKDTKLQQVAGPALNKLLERGQFDAILNLSSLTIAAISQPDKFRVLFAPNEYWEKKTGFPIMAVPIVAWRSWVNEDKTRAKNFAAATVGSFKWLEKPVNLQTAVKSHGELAGVTNSAEIDAYKLQLAKNQMFLTSWDEKTIGAQWQFLELAKKTGIIKKVPSKDKYTRFVGELGT